MVVDQIDRESVSPRTRSRLGLVGRGVSRSGHGAAALIGRIVAVAVGLIETIVQLVPRLLRTVLKAGGTLIARVVDLGGQIVRQAVGILRHVTT